MAERNVFAEGFQSQLTCSICNDIYTEPKTLPCLHTFCLNCIQEWNEACKKGEKPFSCPTCRSEVDIDNGDVSKLPSSFTYNSLLQLFHSMKIESNHPNLQQELPECASCSKQTVLVGFCPQCEGMLCGHCIEQHKTMKPLRQTHQAALWNEFKKENLNMYVNNRSLCNEKFHEKCHLEYYCKTCCKCICHKCATTRHSTHDKVNVEEAVEDAKRLIREDKNRLNQLLKEYKKELTRCHGSIGMIRNEVNREKEKVLNDTQALMKILQDHQADLIMSLDNALEKHIKTNDEEKNAINSNINQISELIHQCETMDKGNFEQFILESYQSLRDVCEARVQREPAKCIPSVIYVKNMEATQLLHDLHIGKIEQSTIDVSQSSIDPPCSIRCGFENRVTITIRNSKREVCHINKDSIDIQIQDIDGKDVINNVTEDGIGRFHVEYMAEKHSSYQINVHIGQIAISNSPQWLETTDSKADFRHLGTIQVNRINLNPISLALNKTGDIAIVSNNYPSVNQDYRVVMINSSPRHVKEFGGEDAGVGQLKDPWGVIFSRGHILVTDNEDGCGSLKEFALDGAFRRTLCKLPEGMGFTRMCAVNQSIACLCFNRDAKEASIKLFCHQTGECANDITLANVNEPPLFVAHNNKMYFVSFLKMNSVYVFNEVGALLYTIGEDGAGNGQFNHVHGLAAFGDDMLLICDRNNDRVQLFTQGGKYISTLGTVIDKPFDIAVSQDGIVCAVKRRCNMIHLWR